MPRAPLPSPSSTSNTSTSKSTASPRQRDVKPPQSPHNLPSTSKRRRSPSPLPSQTKRHRLSNSSISPNLLLHQRLNAVQDIFTHLIDSGAFPADLDPIRDAMRKCQELGAELDEHFGQQSEPSNICPACNLTLSKMCHLRRHVRTKAVKCPKHAALLSDMSSMQCRRCKRQFTRREDVSRHEAKCSSSLPTPAQQLEETPTTTMTSEKAPPPPLSMRSTSPSTESSTGPASPVLAPKWSSVNSLVPSLSPLLASIKNTVKPSVPEPPPPLPTSPRNQKSSSPVFTSLISILTHIFITLPSTLPSRQRKAFHTCLLRVVPTPTQSQELTRILSHVLGRHATPAWGREQIMELMARENGSADLWAPALARGVESIVFDEKA